MPTRKTALLAAALVLAGEKGLRREFVSEALWPGRGEAQARGSLRNALAALRQVFPDGEDVYLEADLETIVLHAGPDDVDLRAFERRAASSDPADLVAAARLYRGDVLAGVTLPEPLDQWFAPYQRAYRVKALALVERLSEVGAAARPDVEAECQGLAERLLAEDSAAEEAHRALIRSFRRQGRMTAAHRQFDLCKEALQRELGVAPEAQTAALLAATAADDDARPQAGPPAAPLPGAARDRDQPSIIVMPFDNLSGPADEYFVDGVVEEITAALSRVREFFVIARQSAFTYKGRFVDVREVGRELGVDYVVEGTIRRGGDRLRISVQLVSADTRAQLWSERYEGVTNDVFAFQDHIAAQVAGAIHPAVRNAEIALATRKAPENLRAYDLVLQAYPKIWSQNAADNRAAIALLEAATAADPRCGRAYGLLAWCHSQDVVYLWSPDPEVSRQAARAAIDAAATLINDDPTALAAVGSAISQCLDDLDRAASYIERALELDPNNAWAWARHAWLAIYRGEPARAKERFERALALNPRDPLEFNLLVGLAMSIAFAGDYADAKRRLHDVISKYPQVPWANRQLAFVAVKSGDMDTARAAIAALRAVYPKVSIATMRARHPHRNVARLFEPMVEAWRAAGLPES
ncbi:MAG: tetratricopeptide repeat protein [Alphaproteobacteria bacterium]|nr:tetratricopeptide repeat protein [Alphaproteobacteria bacterium]